MWWRRAIPASNFVWRPMPAASVMTCCALLPRSPSKSFCVEDDIRPEARIYRDWKATYTWLALTPKGLGCSKCANLPALQLSKVRGKKKFVEGCWTQNINYGFSSQVLSEHAMTPTHQVAVRKTSNFSPFSACQAQLASVQPTAPIAEGTGEAQSSTSSSALTPATPVVVPSSSASASQPLQPIVTPHTRRWANTVGLVYLVMQHYGGHPEWAQHLQYNARCTRTHTHRHTHTHTHTHTRTYSFF